RHPVGTAGVAVVRVAADRAEQLVVRAQPVAVELDAQPRAAGHGDLAVDVAHESSLDDVVAEVMVVRVGRELQVGEEGAEVQHGGQLDAQLPAGMDADSPLEGLADLGRLPGLETPPPEGGVEADNVAG